jgi:predicted permease
MRRLLRRIYFVLNRRRIERELAEEMDAHREMMPEDRRTSFGNSLKIREESRRVWVAAALEEFWQDLSYGARILWRSPGFTLGAIAVLALGVGANLAEFHIFDALLLHRLNIRDAHSIFQFVRNAKEKGPSLFTQAAVRFYREHSTLFSYMVADSPGPDVILDNESGLRSMFVSGNCFSDLGIAPAWGRLLEEKDAQNGAPAVAVLSYEYWQKHLGANPGIVGRIVHINNRQVQIAGILPYDFDGLFHRRAVVWLPMSLRATLIPGTPGTEDFSRSDVNLYGKPKPGVSLAAAEAQLTALTRELAREHPQRFRTGERIQGVRLPGTGIDPSRIPPAVLLIVALVLLVLLSACANLGNMLLARGLARQREIEIRFAAGAGRGRLIRQLMTENFLLATLGCIAGFVVGDAAARWLLYRLNAPPDIRIATDWQILALGVGCVFLSAFAFGLPPALQAIRRDRKSSARQQMLVTLQVAVSCLLLISSAILTHGAIESATIDLSFDFENMLVVYPQIYVEHLPAAVAREKLDALATRLGGLAGVDSITMAVIPPLSGRRDVHVLPGLPPIYTNYVAPSYFRTMTIPVVRGRTLEAADRDAAVVSESAARAIWLNEDPIGKTWSFGAMKRTIIGVVKDSGANLLSDPDSIEVYLPIDDARVIRSALILHTKADPARLLRAVQAEAIYAREPVTSVLMRTSRAAALEGQRKFTEIIGSLGLIASLLACAGMFALLAFAVARRTREIGIRMAIGARPANIVRALVSKYVTPIGAGVALGVVLAIALSRIARSLTYVPTAQAVDPIGFGAGLICFALITVLATLSPMLKAIRIDPSTTLRHE